MKVDVPSLIMLVVVASIYGIIIVGAIVRARDPIVTVVGVLFGGLIIASFGNAIFGWFDKPHQTYTVNSGVTKEEIVKFGVGMFDAGCVDALKMVARKVPNSHGDPESICGPRSKQAGEQLKGMGF